MCVCAGMPSVCVVCWVVQYAWCRMRCVRCDAMCAVVRVLRECRVVWCDVRADVCEDPGAAAREVSGAERAVYLLHHTLPLTLVLAPLATLLGSILAEERAVEVYAPPPPLAPLGTVHVPPVLYTHPSRCKPHEAISSRAAVNPRLKISYV
jgi:hypothetical protein